MKENSLWFRHDANASTDGKLLILRARHGLEGIGTFWFLIEHMYQNDGYLKKEVIDVLLSGVANAKQMLSTCLELSIFNVKSTDEWYSERLLEEIRRRSHIIEKRRRAGRRGGLVSAKNKTIANAQANAQAKLKRVEESRVEKKRIEKNTYMVADATPHTVNENEMELRRLIRWINESKLFPNEKVFTIEACRKWSVRRRKYPTEKIREAFGNLVNEPDKWKINNNGHRSMAWWLHSDDRIEEMLNCHLKKMTNVKFPGVAFIS